MHDNEKIFKVNEGTFARYDLSDTIRILAYVIEWARWKNSI
jgi:hypothetical protein